MIDERENFMWVRHYGNFCCGQCGATEEAAYAEDAELAAKSSTHWPYYRRRRSPVLRPLTSEERKAAPIHAGVMLYFPDALLAVARVSKAGNDKHNPGEPLHWARGKSMDQRECIARHLLAPDAIDPDSGEAHGAHTAWRALAALQLAEEKRLVGAGIMPMSGVTSG